MMVCYCQTRSLLTLPEQLALAGYECMGLTSAHATRPAVLTVTVFLGLYQGSEGNDCRIQSLRAVALLAVW